jgi:FAD/FMN-containing dehydrogenase
MDAAVVKKLKEVCGADNVTDSPVDLIAYRLAGTPASQLFFSDLRVAPDVVVLPNSAKEVPRILSLANRYRVPVSVRGQSTNCEGCNIPLQGGILLDTSFMNKIEKIDEENMVAIVESGCTTNSLFNALDERGLAFPIRPWFDPHMQVGAWVSSNGNGDYSNIYGIAPQQVVGLEVALPTGKSVRLGSWAYPDGYGAWNRFAGGPDLIGLFCGSVGTLGIITKVALRLVRKRKHIWYRAFGWPREQARDMAMAIYDYFGYGVHNISLNNYWSYRDTPKMMDQLKNENVYFVVNLNQVGHDEEELRLNEKHLIEICRKNRGLDLGEEVCKIALGPPWYTFNSKNLKGKSRALVNGEQVRRGRPGMATILFYSYVPVLKFPDFWDMYENLARKYGLLTTERGPQLFCFGIPPCVLGPYPVLPFAANDPEEVANGREFYRELQNNFLKQGGNPYCIGAVWSREALTNQGAAYELVKKLKEMLDPNHILNPGQI